MIILTHYMSNLCDEHFQSAGNQSTSANLLWSRDWGQWVVENAYSPIRCISFGARWNSSRVKIFKTFPLEDPRIVAKFNHSTHRHVFNQKLTHQTRHLPAMRLSPHHLQIVDHAHSEKRAQRLPSGDDSPASSGIRVSPGLIKHRNGVRTAEQILFKYSRTTESGFSKLYWQSVKICTSRKFARIYKLVSQFWKM